MQSPFYKNRINRINIIYESNKIVVTYPAQEVKNANYDPTLDSEDGTN